MKLIDYASIGSGYYTVRYNVHVLFYHLKDANLLQKRFQERDETLMCLAQTGNYSSFLCFFLGRQTMQSL